MLPRSDQSEGAKLPVTEADVMRQLLQEALILFDGEWRLCNNTGSKEWEWKQRADMALNNPLWEKSGGDVRPVEF